eukprot:7919042-Pyramimonas_sp.AAC.1
MHRISSCPCSGTMPLPTSTDPSRNGNRVTTPLVGTSRCGVTTICGSSRPTRPRRPPNYGP